MTMVTQNPLKPRGSIPVDTHYLDEQIEEKRLRDAQLAQQEKQQGGWAPRFFHLLFSLCNYGLTLTPHHYLS